MAQKYKMKPEAIEDMLQRNALLAGTSSLEAPAYMSGSGGKEAANMQLGEMLSSVDCEDDAGAGFDDSTGGSSLASMAASAGVDWEEGSKREGQVLGELLGVLEPLEKEVLMRLHLPDAARALVEESAAKSEQEFGPGSLKAALRYSSTSSGGGSSSTSTTDASRSGKSTGDGAIKRRKRVAGQKNVEDVAKELGLPKSSVSFHATRAVKKLRLAVAQLDQAVQQQQQEQSWQAGQEGGLAGGQQQSGQVIRLLGPQQRLLELLTAEGVVSPPLPIPLGRYVDARDGESSNGEVDSQGDDKAMLECLGRYLAVKQHMPGVGEVWEGLPLGDACHKWQLSHGQEKLSSEMGKALSGLAGWVWEYPEGSLKPDSRYRFTQRVQQLKERQGVLGGGANGKVGVSGAAGVGQSGKQQEQQQGKGKRVHAEEEVGAALKVFVRRQQLLQRLGILSPHRKRVLDAIPGWSWEEGGPDEAIEAIPGDSDTPAVGRNTALVLESVGGFQDVHGRLPLAGEEWEGRPVGDSCRLWQLQYVRGKMPAAQAAAISGRLQGWQWEATKGSVIAPYSRRFNRFVEALRERLQQGAVGSAAAAPERHVVSMPVTQEQYQEERDRQQRQQQQRGKGQKWTTWEPQLGELEPFVRQQQLLYKLGGLEQDRVELLEGLPGWSWERDQLLNGLQQEQQQREQQLGPLEKKKQRGRPRQQQQQQQQQPPVGAPPKGIEQQQDSNMHRTIGGKSQRDSPSGSPQLHRLRQSADVEQAVVAQEQVKKRQGRPRKQEEPQEQQEGGSVPQLEAPSSAAKSRRGRSQKQLLMQLQQVDEEPKLLGGSVESIEAAGKGRRARRSKACQEQLLPQNEQQQQQQEQHSEQQQVSVGSSQIEPAQKNGFALEQQQQRQHSSQNSRMQQLHVGLQRDQEEWYNQLNWNGGESADGTPADKHRPDLAKELQKYLLLADEFEQEFGSFDEVVRELLPVASRWKSP